MFTGRAVKWVYRKDTPGRLQWRYRHDPLLSAGMAPKRRRLVAQPNRYTSALHKRGAVYGNPQMVAASGLLSDLPAQFCRRQRRRHRRFPRHDRQAGLSARPGHRRDLAFAALSVAVSRLRLRHFRLHRRRPGIRHAGGFQGVSATRRTPAISASCSTWCSITPRISIPGLSNRAPAATTPNATGTSGGTARTTGRRTTGPRSSAGRPGSSIPQTGQYYYHAFLKEQPDLNWRNPEVKQAMWEAVRFWLDLGVDGFRLDAIATIFEHPDLPDQHPDRCRPTRSCDAECA